jgi:hypothetical protein
MSSQFIFREHRSTRQSRMTQALIFRIRRLQKDARALKKGCRANADILYSSRSMCKFRGRGWDFEPYARHNQFGVRMNVPSTEIDFAIFYYAVLPQPVLAGEHV